MWSSSPPSNQAFWLEPFTFEKHLQDFHELCIDERANFWSSVPITGKFEDSKKRAFLRNPEKPWLIGCAVVSSEYSAPDGIDGEPQQKGTATKMVGAVRTTRPTPWGLSIGYKLRSNCWGKGYATRAVQGFLDVYWSQTRTAPRWEVYEPAEKNCGGSAAGVVTSSGEGVGSEGARSETADGHEEIEITHLIAQVDPLNIASMRAAEKCGGKLVTVSEKCVKVWRFKEMRDMAVWRFDKPSTAASST